MPARPPGAPWRIPAHFAICRLPENKIRLVALVARLVAAGMIPTFGRPSENALRTFVRVEEDVSVDDIGIAGVNETFEHLDHPRSEVQRVGKGCVIACGSVGARSQ